MIFTHFLETLDIQTPPISKAGNGTLQNIPKANNRTSAEDRLKTSAAIGAHQPARAPGTNPGPQNVQLYQKPESAGQGCQIETNFRKGLQGGVPAAGLSCTFKRGAGLEEGRNPSHSSFGMPRFKMGKNIGKHEKTWWRIGEWEKYIKQGLLALLICRDERLLKYTAPGLFHEP